jgi:predicted NBD/HSP70 family sugar kinase
MSQILSTVAVIGIDIGKNSFHVVGLDGDGAIVLRQKWSRGQIEARLAKAFPKLDATTSSDLATLNRMLGMGSTASWRRGSRISETTISKFNDGTIV